MIGVTKYKSLEHTLLGVKQQIKDSLPYARRNCSGFSSPESLFEWLKSNVTYKRDTTGRELVQTLPTLFERNVHGIPGAGDCDCFTVAGLSCLLANGFRDLYVVIAGRTANAPSHIYGAVKYRGKIFPFDLTNTYFGMERKTYGYKQTLPLRLNENFFYDLNA